MFSKRYFSEDIAHPPFTVSKNGTIEVPNEPGLGVKVIEEKLERITHTKKEFV